MANITIPRPSELGKSSDPMEWRGVYSPPPAADAGTGDFAFSYYWFLLSRRRWLIVTITLVTTAVVSLLTLALPKKYAASVLVRVDPQERSVVGDNANSQGGGGPDATLLVSTEAQVIASPAVVSELIQTLNLASVPEFTPAHANGGALTALQWNQLARQVTNDISVGQPIGTLLLQIGFTCHNPDLAAKAANTLAQVYLEHEYSTRAQALHDASRTMSDQLDAMRAQMEQAQSALIDYESSHDVIDPDDKDNIYNARLTQINTALSAATDKRMNLQAEYALAQSGTPDALAATTPGQTLEPLEERLHADQHQLGELATVYGIRHPLYIQQQKVVRYDNQMVAVAAQHIAAQIDAQYQAALGQEELLQGALDQEKTAVDAFNMRTIRYHALKAASDSATQLYYNIQQSIGDATVAAGLHSEELRIVSPAQASPIPVFPRPLLYGFLALVGSFGLAIVGVVVAGLMDKTVSTPEQVEMRFHAKVLGSLPFAKLLPRLQAQVLPAPEYRLEAHSVPAVAIAPIQRHSAYEEAILGLHSAVQFSAADPLRVFAVTSAVPGEGKSTVCCHLAQAFAELGTKTVLIDADMRKPNVHRIFHLSNTLGLSSLLRQQKGWREAVQWLRPNFAVLTAGPSPLNPAELLHAGMAGIVEQLRNEFAMVMVDCPPVLGLVDAALVSNLSDGFLLVVKAGATEQDLVAAALRQMQAVRAQPLGVVLNQVSEKVGAHYTYYKYNQSYYNAENGDGDEGSDANE